MELLHATPPWSIYALLALTNLLILISIRRTDQHQVRVSYAWQLGIFDVTVLILLVFLSSLRLEDIPVAGWFLIAVLFLLPLALYWVWLCLVSVFLLPLRLSHWREWRDAARALTSYVRGVNHPYYAYNEQKGDLEERLPGRIMARRGGPGIVLLRPEHAVALYAGPKFTRVVGGDIVFTWRREDVLALVDLRPHMVAATDVESVTKDGIGVKFSVYAPCRIKAPVASSGAEREYPFDPKTVFKVLQGRGVGRDGANTWYDIVQQKVEQATRDVVSNYLLDRMLTAEVLDEVTPREDIRARIQDRLIADLNMSKGDSSGIDIIGVAIGNIEPTDTRISKAAEEAQDAGRSSSGLGVLDQRIASWKADWQRQELVYRADSEAKIIEMMGKARAEVLTQLMWEVDVTFQELLEQDAQPNDVVALSFINAFEQLLTKMPGAEPTEMAESRTIVDNLKHNMLLSGTPGLGRS